MKKLIGFNLKKIINNKVEIEDELPLYVLVGSGEKSYMVFSNSLISTKIDESEINSVITDYKIKNNRLLIEFENGKTVELYKFFDTNLEEMEEFLIEVETFKVLKSFL